MTPSEMNKTPPLMLGMSSAKAIAVVIMLVRISMLFLAESTGFEKSTIRRNVSRKKSSAQSSEAPCVCRHTWSIIEQISINF